MSTRQPAIQKPPSQTQKPPRSPDPSTLPYKLVSGEGYLQPGEVERITITTIDYSEYIIVAIMILLILIFWVIVIILAIWNESKTAVSTGGQVLVNCPIGQCATNIFNGEKRCPDSIDGTIVSNAGIEVCNPVDSCTHGKTPFALQNDQSVRIDGLCDEGVPCRCLSRAQCPDYIAAYFKVDKGNPYGAVIGTRTTFRQVGESDIHYTGSATTTRPLSYEDPSSEFCTIPSSWISRSTPGCPIIGGVTHESIYNCINDQGNTRNPCINGTLAYIMDDSSTFDCNSYQRIPMGCVTAEPCPSGKIPIWDRGYKDLVCKNYFPCDEE